MMNIKPLTIKNSAVFNCLVEGLDKVGDAKKIDNTNRAFMPVSVEKIFEEKRSGVLFEHFSVCHYYEQNGDLMRDPEMTFIKVNTAIGAKIFPAYFRQDNIAKEEFSIWRDETGKILTIKKLQADHTSFANLWMRNIRDQQGIKI